MKQGRSGQIMASLGALVLLSAVATAAWGSATGLNNIPTADVPPANTLVFQYWGNVANDTRPEHFVGFKYGLLDGLEVGLDWKADGESHGHLQFQTKYAFDVKEDFMRAAVGIANASQDRKHTGGSFPYAVTSYDFKSARVHLGFTFQDDNEGFFAGFDKTFPVLNRDFLLRLDAIQVNDMDDVLYSAGFLYNLRPRDDAPEGEGSSRGFWENLTRNTVVEAWISLPSSSDEDTVTIKLNHVIEF